MKNEISELEMFTFDQIKNEFIGEIGTDKRTHYEHELKQFTKKQLIVRAKRSSKDYLAGKFKTQDQLENESENW